MELNEEEQLALKKFIESDLYKKAEQVVLSKSNGPIFDLLAPEQAMALAQEKGVRNAFRIFRDLINPKQFTGAPRLSSTTRRTHKEQ